ncbi:hypothetical protein OKC48_07265 [Methylorubrum extorquens]|uniref:hypothetical protein n=1 Tax=Methylorubrum extorquens TaxID=408 RepID=UPI002237E1EB|nr:hypothetical protein [Methylorubrum extorquens]UYW28306.1 hypothetical protein OKC48_07265 [Methylorubrum extorquens]
MVVAPTVMMVAAPAMMMVTAVVVMSPAVMAVSPAVMMVMAAVVMELHLLECVRFAGQRRGRCQAEWGRACRAGHRTEMQERCKR